MHTHPHSPSGTAGRALIATLAAIAASGAVGCGGRFRPSAAIDRARVIDSASFDHACPVERIRVVSAAEDTSGTCRFLVDVCGATRTYKRVGSMYYDAGRSGDPPG